MTNNSIQPQAGIYAANQFYRLVKSGNPVAKARWRDIQAMARQGDLEAVRAVRLMLAVTRQPMVGAVTQATPQQIEMLRAILIQARNAPPIPAVVTPTQMAPAGPRTVLGINPATGRPWEQIPGTIPGYMGEGTYSVVEPNGLFLYPAPNPTLPSLRIVPFGTMVRVLSFAPPPNPIGWVQVVLPSGEGGYVCLSCQDLRSSAIPGGPWLVRTDSTPKGNLG